MRTLPVCPFDLQGGPAPSPWGGHVVVAAEILDGRQVGSRLEPTTLTFFDLGHSSSYRRFQM
jgi:hypothetical protein